MKTIPAKEELLIKIFLENVRGGPMRTFLIEAPEEERKRLTYLEEKEYIDLSTHGSGYGMDAIITNKGVYHLMLFFGLSTKYVGNMEYQERDLEILAKQFIIDSKAPQRMQEQFKEIVVFIIRRIRYHYQYIKDKSFTPTSFDIERFDLSYIQKIMLESPPSAMIDILEMVYKDTVDLIFEQIVNDLEASNET